MAKHSVRVLWVVLVAGIISAGLYVLSQTPAIAGMIPQREGLGPLSSVQTGEESEWDNEGGEYDRDRWRGEVEGSGRQIHARKQSHEQRDELSVAELLPGLAKHVGLIVLVALVVAAIQQVGSMLGGKHKPTQAVGT